MPDREAFERAKKKIIGIDRQRPGIGTLSEKTVRRGQTGNTHLQFCCGHIFRGRNHRNTDEAVQ